MSTAPEAIDIDRLLKLRLVVARFGEMDGARWWNTNGVLGKKGGLLLSRGFPKTHRFAQARLVFEVARARSTERFPAVPGCVTLWSLPARVEDEFDARWAQWLENSDSWAPFFDSLENPDSDLLAMLDARELGNSGSARAYKAQLFIYNRALGRLQGYLPPKAYLLGRGWKQGSERGSSCMERLAPVPHASNISKGYSLGEATRDAVDWIRRARTEGRRWTVLPEPSINELRPNMSHVQDAPWHGAKRQIGHELEDLTLLWQVGIDKRIAANEAGILRWTDEGFTAADVGVKGAKQGPILDALLEINRDKDGPPVRPAHIAAAEDEWRDPAGLEFYVDFETVSDLDDDFSNIPEKGGQPLIFMIGCGHVQDGDWVFRCFTADALKMPRPTSSTPGSDTCTRSRSAPRSCRIRRWCSTGHTRRCPPWRPHTTPRPRVTPANHGPHPAGSTSSRRSFAKSPSSCVGPSASG